MVRPGGLGDSVVVVVLVVGVVNGDGRWDAWGGDGAAVFCVLEDNDFVGALVFDEEAARVDEDDVVVVVAAAGGALTGSDAGASGNGVGSGLGGGVSSNISMTSLAPPPVVLGGPAAG